MANTTLYNPASLNKEDLISSFVVRTKTFEKIYKDIKDSDMRYPEKHYIIQGQRGMGKTTLLLRLKYEVEQDDKLNKWLIPIFFNEEAYDVNSLAGLWEKLLKYLDEYFETNGKYYDYTEQFIDAADYEKKCFEYFVEILRKNKRKLVLFFDNFGELFLDNLRDKEKRRLREILIDCNDLRIVGASAVVINDLHDYSQPFYEFFHIIRLDGLTKEETFELIGKLQESCEEARKIDLKRSKAKIDTLSILTGGVVRTIMMLYQVLLDDADGSALEDLEKVLDKATPLYKHRIEDLPVQQRRIVDVIAKKWDAVSAKEIAQEIREDGRNVATKLVSAQLNQLEKNNIVEKKETNTKNHLYQLKERFFNIWYLMRNGDRRDKRRAAWLTKFLETWYDDEDGIDTFIKNHISLLKSGKYRSAAALMIAQALVNSDKISPAKLDNVIDETSAILNEEEQQYLPDITSTKHMIAVRHLENGKYTESIEVLQGVKKATEVTYLLAAFVNLSADNKVAAIGELQKIKNIEEGDLSFYKSLCLNLGAYDLCINVISESKGLDQDLKEASLGDVYKEVKEYDNAREHYTKAIELGNNSVFTNLADVLKNQGNFKEAENLLLEAYTKKKIDAIPLLDMYLISNDPRTGKVSDNVDALLKELGENPLSGLYKALFFLNTGKLTKEKDDKVVMELEKFVSIYNKNQQWDYKFLFGCSLLLTSYIFGENKKSKAADLVNMLRVNRLEKEPMIAPSVIFVDIWNENYSDVIEGISRSTRYFEIDKGDVLNDILMLLIAKKQNHIALKIFNENPAVVDLAKPTYYALMTILKDQFPNEIIKMGEELKEPVKEILERIREMAIQYK